METFEDLGTAIGQVSFESEALIKRAVAEGRRHQRRRRVGTGVGAVAVGTLAVGAGFHYSGTTSHDGTTVSSQPTIGADGRVVLPSAELTDERLAARLPAPSDPVSTDQGPDVSVVRSLDPDGAGSGLVTVDLDASRQLSEHAVSTTAAKCHKLAGLHGPESCTPLKDGWVFTLAEGGGDSSRSTKWDATMVRRDGTSVAVDATNFVHQGDPTRPSPVLDLDQIIALATDPVWFEPAS